MTEFSVCVVKRSNRPFLYLRVKDSRGNVYEESTRTTSERDAQKLAGSLLYEICHSDSEGSVCVKQVLASRKARRNATERKERQFALLADEEKKRRRLRNEVTHLNRMIQQLNKKTTTTWAMPAVPVPNTTVSSVLTKGKLSDELIAGVYFLWDTGRVVYVGQSGDLASRMKSHHVARKSMAVSVINMDSAKERLYAEAFYIWLLRPELNWQHANE